MFAQMRVPDLSLRLNDCQNLQFGCWIHHSSQREVLGHFSPSRLCKFVKLDLRKLKPVYAMLYPCGDCAHHPARFVIFAQLAQLCIIVSIILFFQILPIIGSCKIALIIADRVRHRHKCCLGFSGCQSHLFSISHIFLILLNHCLWVFNWLAWHSGLTIRMILDPFLFHFFATRCISLCISAASLLPNGKLRNPSWAWNVSASELLPPSFSWLRRHVEHLVNLTCSAASFCGRFCFGALTIVFCVVFVDGRDVWCCNIWTTWSQAEWFMSRLLHLIDLNQAKSAFWTSLHWE